MVGPGTALALLCLRLCAVQAVNSDKTQPTRNVVITAEEEKLRDPEGFAAIKELHRLMDDDQSGSIDRFESADVSVLGLLCVYGGLRGRNSAR